jgi:hypothetical protein
MSQDLQNRATPETCELDGCWEDDYGDEHYWHCEEPVTATVLIAGRACQVCANHAEDRETLDELASKIAYSILLRAFAEFGFTDTAYAAAFAAVALSDAFENNDGSHPGCCHKTGGTA